MFALAQQPNRLLVARIARQMDPPRPLMATIWPARNASAVNRIGIGRIDWPTRAVKDRQSRSHIAGKQVGWA